jgi:hypothetical protein
VTFISTPVHPPWQSHCEGQAEGKNHFEVFFETGGPKKSKSSEKSLHALLIRDFWTFSEISKKFPDNAGCSCRSGSG